MEKGLVRTRAVTLLFVSGLYSEKNSPSSWPGRVLSSGPRGSATASSSLFSSLTTSAHSRSTSRKTSARISTPWTRRYASPCKYWAPGPASPVVPRSPGAERAGAVGSYEFPLLRATLRHWTVFQRIWTETRIVKVIDICDALRTRRPYKRAYSHEETLSVLRFGDGRVSPAHLDPTVLSAFLDHQEEAGRLFDEITGTAPSRVPTLPSLPTRCRGP